MNTVTKPIKRSRYLAPLSREHHDDLLFSWKIHRGLAMSISLERIMRYCNWFYELHLRDHFRKEERALSKILPIEHPMMVKMFEDHEVIKLRLKILNEAPTADGLERLAKFLSGHVRFEEREMFNFIENIATLDQLNELLYDLTSTPRSRLEWIDEFWICSI